MEARLEHLEKIEQAKRDLRMAVTDRRKSDCRKHLHRLTKSLAMYDRFRKGSTNG